MGNILLDTYLRLLQHYGEQDWWPVTSPYKTEIAIGAILTQNTSWKNVEKSLRNLSFDTDYLLSLSGSDLEEAVRPSGFFTRKAITIRLFLDWFAQYNYEDKNLTDKPLDELRKELLSINGIGPETADSILLYAFDRAIFVVDNYTKRLFVKLGQPQFKYYSEYQTYIQEKIVADIYVYRQYHALIVAYAKDFLVKRRETPEIDPLQF